MISINQVNYLYQSVSYIEEVLRFALRARQTREKLAEQIPDNIHPINPTNTQDRGVEQQYHQTGRIIDIRV